MALIAHFKLNGDTIDTVGTYSSNTPTAITYTNLGKLDGAAIFNGSSSAILLGSTINLAGNANWTVSVWVKTSSTARMSILSNSSGGPVANDICIEGGKISYYHYNAAWLFKQGTIPINDGNWHHLAWVNFVGNKMNMYVDGILDQSQVDSTQSIGPVNQIGKNWSSDYFNGTMDDLKIFNGASITENEILEMSFNKQMMFHFPFNKSNTNDYTGKYQTITSGVSYSTSGKIGSALNMSTTSIQVNGFDGKSVSSFSLGFWLYNINSGAGGLFGTISGTRSINVYRYPTLNDLHWSFGVGGGVDTGVLPFDTWTHVLLTFDGITNEFKRYYNGVLYGTTVSERDRNTNPFYIARNDSGYSAGLLNDVRMYNYILSDYEIKELAKAKILHYSFDDPYEEPTINICYDLALNYYDKSRFYSTDGDGFSEVLIGNKKWLQYNSGSRRLASLSISANTAYTWSLKIISPADSSISFTEWDGGGYGTRSYSITEGYNEVSHTFTSRASSTYEILHLGAFPVGSKLADFQLEAKDHSTPITNGTRNIGVNDISGYKKHGAISSITESPKWVTDSKVGSGSIYFNGTTPHIISGLTNLGGLTTVTISFWRKNDTSITHWLPFVGQTTSHYIMATSSGTGGFYHADIGSSWEIFKDGVAQGPLVAVTPFTDQLWHHYAIRGVNLSSWTQFRISGYGSAWNMEGYIDDLRIYNTNLSDSDILALYNKKANLDNLGNVQVGEINLTDSYFPSSVDYSTWIVGNSSATGWDRNGTSDENIITVKDNPVNQADIMWATLSNDATSDGDGGFSSPSVTIDNSKKYRYSIWIKRENIGDGRTYFGCGWSTVSNLGVTEAVNGNPYFVNYVPNDKPNIGAQWVLIVAHIHPAGYTGSIDPISGIYDIYGNKISSIATDYKWLTTSTLGSIRAYLFYSTSTNERQYFYRPRIDMIDGNEPSLEELIKCTDNPVLYGRTIADIDKKALFNANSQAVFRAIDEVFGTKNSAVQHEITNTGTLIINGEFSEVD